MQKLALTGSAFDRLYGSSRLVVMSAGLYQAVAEIVPASLDILLLAPIGHLYVPGEASDFDAASLSPVGAPVGLLGFVVDGGGRNWADTWSSWSLSQTGRTAPPVWQIEAGDTALIMRSLAEIGLDDAAHSRLSAAQVQTDLAVLRRDFERSLINLEKARRIIRGAGYDTRYSTLSVPAGPETVAPDGETGPLTPYTAKYDMPVDAAGVVGISLHFVVPAGTLADGHFTVLLKRSVDRRILGSAELQFSDITAGWKYFELERGLQRSFGDAELVFEWIVSGKGSVPEVSLTAAEPDRCGAPMNGNKIGADPSKSTLSTLPAMQIWSGFAPGELADDQGFSGSPKERRRAAIGGLLKRATDLAGESAIIPASDIGPSGAWVQTHLRDDGPVGLCFEKLVPASARTLTVSCEAGHPSTPTCLYLVAVGGPSALNKDYLIQLFERAQNSDETKGIDEGAGVSWCIHAVAPGVRHDIEVELTALSDKVSDQNLSMTAVSTTESTDFGWCRWQDLSVELDTVEGHSTVYHSLDRNRQIIQRMRSVKFPEIGERLEFLAGRARLQKLTEQWGFSPMIVADDNGSLQTHPLKQDISAAIYRSGAAVGTTRVACDVETAHERAPDFIYVIALVNAETSDKYDLFKAFVAKLMQDEFHTASGFEPESQIYYSAQRLAALQVKAISIDLDAPLDVEHDIIVAALPVHDIISYGWCRWLSLSVATALDPHQQFKLKAPDQ